MARKRTGTQKQKESKEEREKRLLAQQRAKEQAKKYVIPSIIAFLVVFALLFFLRYGLGTSSSPSPFAPASKPNTQDGATEEGDLDKINWDMLAQFMKEDGTMDTDKLMEAARKLGISGDKPDVSANSNKGSGESADKTGNVVPQVVKDEI
ncbi:hypothetical protein BKA69DRAFT_1042140 [Paraphysoderma sedebokerense]|nr:hypothetical protein BKA69DRAFT_1042140 [Paraphysoderma sedebokerense]